MPAREMERICVTPGIPVIATSTGWVTIISISVGDRPGALVSTWTCTFVTSGTASMGSRMYPRIPCAISPITKSKMMKRARTEYWTSLPIIRPPMPT